jgi:hypothetical protein
LKWVSVLAAAMLANKSVFWATEAQWCGREGGSEPVLGCPCRVSELNFTK